MISLWHLEQVILIVLLCYWIQTSSCDYIKQCIYLHLHGTVPAPKVYIVQTPSTGVYPTTLLNLTCITVLDPEVDTPMAVTHSWRGPSGSIFPYSSHPSVYNVTQVGQVYRSTILFSSGMRSSDSGTYSCKVNTSSISSSSYVMTRGSVIASTNISVGKGEHCLLHF